MEVPRAALKLCEHGGGNQRSSRAGSGLNICKGTPGTGHLYLINFKTIMELTYTKFEILSILKHPELDEKWIAERIREDPSILGLGRLVATGDCEVCENRHRLNLQLADASNKRRFAVLVQCGPVNEEDIINTIESWDSQRQSSLNYDHVCVIAAEEFPDRFINVLAILNKFLPIVAIKLNAYKHKNYVSLICTTLLNQHYVHPGSDVLLSPQTRQVIQKPHRDKQAGALASELLDFIGSLDARIQPRYNRNYISFETSSNHKNCALFFPQRHGLRFELRLDRSSEIEEKIIKTGLKLIDYSESGWYRIKLLRGDMKRNAKLLADLILLAYREGIGVK